MRLIKFSFFVVLSFFAQTSLALNIGDSAPPLKHIDWLKGDPASFGDGKHIYVIDLWATWCKPCKDSIPDLVETHTKYKDKGVVIIGVSDESKEDVSTFIRRHDEISYSIAVDAGLTFKNYSENTPGFRGLSFAIVVDTQGKVAWFGHEVKSLSKVLDSLLEGSYDEESMKESMEAKGLYTEYFTLLKAGDNDAADRVGEQFLVEAANDPNLLINFANTIVGSIALRNAYADLDQKILKVDRDLAQRAAELVYKAANDANASFIDFYARVLCLNGDIGGAIKYQEEAIQVCKERKLLRHLKSNLRDYHRRQKKLAKDPNWHPKFGF